MREYIRKSSGIPASVYTRVKALLKDYDRMQRMRANLLYGTPPPVNGHGSSAGNPTEQKAIKLAAISSELDAIDQICILLRGEYSGKTLEDFDPIKAYWQYDYFNYQHIRTERNPNGPSTRTWHRYKDKFTLLIAQKLNFF
jgi:hypothetical protein